MTLNNLATLPRHPLTKFELEALDTSNWKRYTVTLPGGLFLDRFPVYQNDGYFWGGDVLYGNKTPQCIPMDAVQAIFYRTLENGVRITQPVEVVPTADELKSIARYRKTLDLWHHGPHGHSVITESKDQIPLLDAEDMLRTIGDDIFAQCAEEGVASA